MRQLKMVEFEMISFKDGLFLKGQNENVFIFKRY